MTSSIKVAVPRKGRPLEAVLDRIASSVGSVPVGPDGDRSIDELADEISSTLRYEKAVTKGRQDAAGNVYDRLSEYSDLDRPSAPEYTLLRDDRQGKPRRIVFDSVTVVLDDLELQLIGREEPFRAVRTHEFALGFDSADLVLEEVVDLRPEPLSRIADLNARIDPRQTDVRVVTGLGDTVYHTLLATPETVQAGPSDALDREFVAAYEGPLCISPRYERLVSAVLGTSAIEGIDFRFPAKDREEEEAAIAETGLGIYLTVTGSTARDHGLVLGEQLFPSETVLLENVAETDAKVNVAKDRLVGDEISTALAFS